MAASSASDLHYRHAEAQARAREGAAHGGGWRAARVTWREAALAEEACGLARSGGALRSSGVRPDTRGSARRRTRQEERPSGSIRPRARARVRARCIGRGLVHGALANRAALSSGATATPRPGSRASPRRTRRSPSPAGGAASARTARGTTTERARSGASPRQRGGEAGGGEQHRDAGERGGEDCVELAGISAPLGAGAQ
jgi:hypothetical protein